MAISKKKQNKKYKSKRNQYGGNDCKFPNIWENEQNGECVKVCPEDTCPRYDMFGKFKCATSCSYMSPALRSGLTGLKNKATNLIGKTVSDTGTVLQDRYGKDYLYYGPLKRGILESTPYPQGYGLIVDQDTKQPYIYGNFYDGKFKDDPYSLSMAASAAGDFSIQKREDDYCMIYDKDNDVVIEQHCSGAPTREFPFGNITDYYHFRKKHYGNPINGIAKFEGFNFTDSKMALGKAEFVNGDIFIGKFKAIGNLVFPDIGRRFINDPETSAPIIFDGNFRTEGQILVNNEGLLLTSSETGGRNYNIALKARQYFNHAEDTLRYRHTLKYHDTVNTSAKDKEFARSGPNFTALYEIDRDDRFL